MIAQFVITQKLDYIYIVQDIHRTFNGYKRH